MEIVFENWEIVRIKSTIGNRIQISKTFQRILNSMCMLDSDKKVIKTKFLQHNTKPSKENDTNSHNGTGVMQRIAVIIRL